MDRYVMISESVIEKLVMFCLQLHLQHDELKFGVARTILVRHFMKDTH